MKLFAAIFVLFVASFQIPYTAKGHEGGDMDSSETDIGLSRKDLREVRSELRRKSNSDGKERKRRNNLKKRITKLETEVTNLKSEQASSQHAFLNLQEGVLTERRMRQQLEKDLAELKTAIRLSAAELSEFQVAVAPNNTSQQRLCGCRTRSKNITVPKLRFTRAYGAYPERVAKKAGGAAVMDGPMRAWATTVRTDGLFRADHRLYWETRLDWSLVSVPDWSDWWWVGSVGVRREGSYFSTSPGEDHQSWAVQIQYNNIQKTWRYVCLHGGTGIFQSAPLTPTSPSVSHRLGLLLEPRAGTLTAVDVNTNAQLCTFSLPAGDAGSQRLVPVVWFGFHDYERRFRLLGVDPCRLPGAVTDLLQN